MTAAEAIKIVAERLSEMNATKAEVIEALVYNLVVEQIGEQIEFLRDPRTWERKAGKE